MWKKHGCAQLDGIAGSCFLQKGGRTGHLSGEGSVSDEGKRALPDKRKRNFHDLSESPLRIGSGVHDRRSDRRDHTHT